MKPASVDIAATMVLALEATNKRYTATGRVESMKPSAALLLLVILYGFNMFVSLYRTELESVKFYLIPIGLILSVAVYYWQFYTPLISLRERESRLLIDHLLQNLVQTYKEARPGAYELRANAMRVRRRFWLLGRRYLQMQYCSDGYSGAEKEQRYRLNVGCSGTALSENAPVYFDAREKHEHYKGMTETQRLVTDHVKSILSVPVYKPRDTMKKDPVAILSMDSTSYVDDSGFGDSELQTLTFSYAGLIGIVLG